MVLFESPPQRTPADIVEVGWGRVARRADLLRKKLARRADLLREECLVARRADLLKEKFPDISEGVLGF